MIGLEEFYWYLKLGKPKRKLSVFRLREELNTFVPRPVFFLSTGRCGTRWYSDLLQEERNLAVFHSPVPSLAMQGRVVWEMCSGAGMKPDAAAMRVLTELFFAGRESHLRYTAKTGKRYVETNNYITFFAPVLAELFPDARFVHLVRHPAGFIRSGLDRGYYSEGNPDDLKRIVPRSGKDDVSWETLSRYGKTAWLWTETNRFIDRFRASIPAERSMVSVFGQPDMEEVKKVLEFISLDIPEKKIKKALTVKKNVQKNREYPPFNEWTQDEKDQVLNVSSEQASVYEFKY